GATVVIGPPSRAASSGSRLRWASIACQPSPSNRSRTTALAPSTPEGSVSRGRPPRSVGTKLVIASPPQSGRTGSTGYSSRAFPASMRGQRLRTCSSTRAHGAVKVSPRRDYAGGALLSLALHGKDRQTSVKEIAERTSLPQPYLEQILLAVKGAGLVRSKRGVGGGYVLARAPEEITLAEILTAVDGPLTTLMGEHDHCEGHCILQEVWVCVSEEMRQLLEGFTLAQLVQRTRIGHPDAAARSSAGSGVDPVEHGSGPGGQGVLEGEALPGRRVREGKPVRMQERPVEPNSGAVAAIGGVAHHRVPDGAQMNAELVRASRLEAALDEGHGGLDVFHAH